MKVRRIHADEGARLRDLRLRALAEAPDAFATSLGAARARPQAYWEEFAERAATSDTTATFVVEDGAQWHGLGGGFFLEGRRDTAELVAMWVDPARRRSRIGTALVDAIVQWARGRGAKRVQLWVTQSNDRAISLYVRHGFVETAHTETLPSNPALRIVLMVRELCP